MGYKTKSMIYFKSDLKKGLKTPFDISLSDKFSKSPDELIKTDSKKTDKSTVAKEAGAYSKGTKLLNKTGQDAGVLSGLASGSAGTQAGTAIGIMVNKIRKNKKQKNLSEGKEDQQFSSMSDSYFKTKIAAERAKSYLGGFKKNESISTPKGKTERLNIDVVTPIKTKPVNPFVNPTKNIGIVPREEKTNKELKKHFKKEGRKKNNKKIDNQESKYSADFSKFSTKEFPEQITAVGLGQDLTKTLYLNNAKKQGFTRDQAMRNVNVTQQTDGYRAYKYEMSGGKNPAFYEETPKKKSLFGRKKTVKRNK